MKTEALKELVAGLDLQTDLWWLAMILSGFLATFLAAMHSATAGHEMLLMPGRLEGVASTRQWLPFQTSAKWLE